MWKPKGWYSWRGWFGYWLQPAVRYAVITRVSDTGNLHDDYLLRRPLDGETLYVEMAGTEDKALTTAPAGVDAAAWFRLHVLRVKLRTFWLGEILLVDRDGREVAGHGRKPDKWDVDCEFFWTSRAALRRARQLSNE